MRSIPVDVDAIELISTGTVSPVPMWVVLSDGSRRPDPSGRQALDEVTGAPVWTVSVIVPLDETDERDQESLVQVTVTSHDRPEVGRYQAVMFEGLRVSMPYYSKAKAQMSAPRWTATGVRSARSGNGRPSPTTVAAS